MSNKRMITEINIGHVKVFLLANAWTPILPYIDNYNVDLGQHNKYDK